MWLSIDFEDTQTNPKEAVRLASETVKGDSPLVFSPLTSFAMTGLSVNCSALVLGGVISVV